MKDKKITLFGTKWTIKIVNDPFEEGTHGITHLDKKIIYIKNGMDVETTNITIMHELLHAALYSGGHRYLNYKCETIDIFATIIARHPEVFSLRVEEKQEGYK